MLKNLQAEMVRNGVQVASIAKTIKKSDRTVRDKIGGRYEFTIPEAFAIRDAYFSGMTLEYLFNAEVDATDTRDSA